MSSDDKPGLGVYLGIAFFLVSSLWALKVVLLPGAAPRAAAPAARPAPPISERRQVKVIATPFGDAADAEALQARVMEDRYGRMPEEPPQSLGMVHKPGTTPPPPPPPGETVRGQVRPNPTPKTAEHEAMEEAGLSGGEMKALVNSAGSWDAAAARRAGSTRGMLFEMGKALLQYPRIVAFVLNNDHVVAGFMAQRRVRENCENTDTLTNYLADGRASVGVRMGMHAFEQSLRHEGSTDAIMESRLVRRVLSSCPAVKGVTGSPQRVSHIAMSNPELLQLYMNPKITQGLLKTDAGRGVRAGVASAQRGG